MDAGQIIYNTLRGDGIPDPLASFVVAQARHETGNFTSNVFLQCNNAFGYKAVYGALECSQAPEGGSYEYYPGGVQDSAHEISRYLYRRQADGSFPSLSSITTLEQYASLLKSVGYYGASLYEYQSGLARWFKQYGSAIGLGSLFLVGLGIFLLSKK